MESNHDNSLKLQIYLPLYAQVKQRLMECLAEGVWRAGDLIPSEMELAQLYRVSQGTIRKAVEELTAEKLLVRRQGKGTFVETHLEERSRYRFLHLQRDDTQNLAFSTHILLCQQQLASETLCDQLELPKGSVALHIRRLMRFEGKPTVLEDIWLPSERFQGLDLTMLTAWDGTMYGLFESGFGIHMVRATEKIRAVSASALACEFLDISPTTPLLEIQRISYTYENQAVECRMALNLTQDVHYFNALN